MAISIINRQKKITLNPRRIKKIIKALLNHEKTVDEELTVVFVSHQKMRALNRCYLNKDRSTDVLAFELEKDRWDKNGRGSPKTTRLSGDVIISTDAVLKNSRRFKTSRNKELALYVIHGVLHLLGYDDRSPEDIAGMRAKEEEYLLKSKL